MQRRISNKIQLGDTLNPALDYSGVPAVDDEANLESIYGKADESLARYIPNLLPVTRQNQLADTNPRKAFASITYSDKKNLEFILELAANTYDNYSSDSITYGDSNHKKHNKNCSFRRKYDNFK